MAIKHRTVGTGITKRLRTTYDGADVKEPFEQWNTKFEKGGSCYGAVTLDLVKACREELEAAGEGPYEPDTQEDFSKRILSQHNLAKIMIERGDADNAARFAYAVGYMHAQAFIKAHWEHSAMKGHSNTLDFRDCRDTRNRTNKIKRESEWQRWQVEAEQVWAVNPRLSKAGAARLVKNRLGLEDTVRTITARLHKPS